MCGIGNETRQRTIMLNSSSTINPTKSPFPGYDRIAFDSNQDHDQLDYWIAAINYAFVEVLRLLYIKGLKGLQVIGHKLLKTKN